MKNFKKSDISPLTKKGKEKTKWQISHELYQKRSGQIEKYARKKRKKLRSISKKSRRINQKL